MWIPLFAVAQSLMERLSLSAASNWSNWCFRVWHCQIDRPIEWGWIIQLGWSKAAVLSGATAAVVHAGFCVLHCVLHTQIIGFFSFKLYTSLQERWRLGRLLWSGRRLITAFKALQCIAMHFNSILCLKEQLPGVCWPIAIGHYCSSKAIWLMPLTPVDCVIHLIRPEFSFWTALSLYLNAT